MKTHKRLSCARIVDRFASSSPHGLRGETGFRVSRMTRETFQQMKVHGNFFPLPRSPGRENLSGFVMKMARSDASHFPVVLSPSSYISLFFPSQHPGEACPRPTPLKGVLRWDCFACSLIRAANYFFSTCKHIIQRHKFSRFFRFLIAGSSSPHLFVGYAIITEKDERALPVCKRKQILHGLLPAPIMNYFYGSPTNKSLFV
jgi:hypothetical protein